MPSIRRDTTIANGSQSSQGHLGEDLYEDGRRRDDRASARPRAQDATRIAAYGTVDELNAVLGLGVCVQGLDSGADGLVAQLQSELFWSAGAR